ncbi:hypothetical protein [Ottowia caeni]|uniref:hypothetical protein n=1 Tax=Ottowia caeni TaxID=2870339 RepID=UPI001E45B82C|nr:hypothetical protein [Ottowia caeni]
MRKTILFIGTGIIAATAMAQSPPLDPLKAQSASACLAPKAFQSHHLFGAWRFELPGTKQTGRMTLRRHPEFSESLRGELRYGSTESIASGDIEEGELNLDESSNRVSITATWTGKIVEGSCGKEIRGEWHDVEKDVRSPFVLRREAGW